MMMVCVWCSVCVWLCVRERVCVWVRVRVRVCSENSLYGQDFVLYKYLFFFYLFS